MIIQEENKREEEHVNINLKNKIKSKMKKKALFVILFSFSLSLMISIIFIIVYKELDDFSKVAASVGVLIMLILNYIAYKDYTESIEINPLRDMEKEIEILYIKHGGDITEIMSDYYSKFGVSPLNDSIFTSTINAIRDRGDLIWN